MRTAYYVVECTTASGPVVVARRDTSRSASSEARRLQREDGTAHRTRKVEARRPLAVGEYPGGTEQERLERPPRGPRRAGAVLLALTAEEREELRAAAERDDRPLAAWIRHVALTAARRPA